MHNFKATSKKLLAFKCGQVVAAVVASAQLCYGHVVAAVVVSAHLCYGQVVAAVVVSA